MLKWLFTGRRAGRLAVLGAVLAAGFVSASKAEASTPAGCAALQAKYPQWKGKTLVNAINPHTPGYEAIDPKDPSKYVGFDIDLGEAIGDCLGFKLTYKPVTFAALLTTLASGQADIVISDIYATKEEIAELTAELGLDPDDSDPLLMIGEALDGRHRGRRIE